VDGRRYSRLRRRTLGWGSLVILLRGLRSLNFGMFGLRTTNTVRLELLLGMGGGGTHS